ncbi:nitrite reductase [Streptomyces sp. Ru87]|uniref:nitrite reductase n=1 Tax=Streptomyces sp. Ru87 TaxID=2044307 RepID=UPI00211D9F1E|nr:nitrite reductase [Streptomyces sp. Ru87]
MADDGALARIRLPGGLLSSRQAADLADIAEELGDGNLDLTSRGNVQLRGLAADCGPELADRLRAAALLPSDTHERVRNVVASPLSGLDGHGYADTAAWARALDRALCANPDAAALSGRFLFALDDGRGDVAALDADVTIVAAPGGAAELRTGAGGPRLAVSAADAPRAAVAAAAAFLQAAATTPGRTWRVRDLLTGPPPGTPPPPAGTTGSGTGPGTGSGSGTGSGTGTGTGSGSGTDALPLGPALLLAHLDRAGIASAPAPRSGAAADGEGPAAAAGGRSEDGATDAGNPPAAAGGANRAGPGDREGRTGDGAGASRSAAPVPGLVTGPDGRCAPVVAAPLGRVTAAAWRLLAELAGREGTAELRVTPWRGVVVPGLPADSGPAALRRLRDAGFVTDPGSPWYGVGACTGLPGCAKSLADVRADAARSVVGALPVVRPETAAGRLPVYWSGCERRCGRPAGARVDVVAVAPGTGDGAVPGYRVTVRGTEPETYRAPAAPGPVPAPHQTAAAPAAARGTTSARAQ